MPMRDLHGGSGAMDGGREDLIGIRNMWIGAGNV